MEDIKSGRKKRGRKKHVLLKLFLALIALILVPPPLRAAAISTA